MPKKSVTHTESRPTGVNFKPHVLAMQSRWVTCLSFMHSHWVICLSTCMHSHWVICLNFQICAWKADHLSWLITHWTLWSVFCVYELRGWPHVFIAICSILRGWPPFELWTWEADLGAHVIDMGFVRASLADIYMYAYGECRFCIYIQLPRNARGCDERSSLRLILVTRAH